MRAAGRPMTGSGLLRLHPEAELIAVEIVRVEIAHAVGVVLRLAQEAGAPRLELLVESR